MISGEVLSRRVTCRSSVHGRWAKQLLYVRAVARARESPDFATIVESQSTMTRTYLIKRLTVLF